MTFQDILKNSFLEGFGQGIDTKSVVIQLCITALLAVYIFFVYRLMTRKTFYSKTFNLSLVAMAIITAAIILTIQSNIVLSLGMVGALSIIRFRTAIKDPLDLVFLYWTISIVCGAGLAVIAVILTVLMSVVVVLMQMCPVKKESMILIVNSTNIHSDKTILETVKKYSKYHKLKSKNMTGSSLDMIVEIRVSEDSALLQDILQIEGVASASILLHDGEVTA